MPITEISVIFPVVSMYIMTCLEHIHQQKETFQKINIYHSYNTRNHDKILPNHRLVRCRKTHNYWCMKFVNHFPNEVRELTTNAFRATVRKLLFNSVSVQ